MLKLSLKPWFGTHSNSFPVPSSGVRQSNDLVCVCLVCLVCVVCVWRMLGCGSCGCDSQVEARVSDVKIDLSGNRLTPVGLRILADAPGEAKRARTVSAQVNDCLAIDSHRNWFGVKVVNLFVCESARTGVYGAPRSAGVHTIHERLLCGTGEGRERFEGQAADGKTTKRPGAQFSGLKMDVCLIAGLIN